MDVNLALSVTIQRLHTLQKAVKLPIVHLGNADTSGLVLDPRSGVRYRPGVVNVDPSEPAGTPEVHAINWGGYGSVQATPQPTQIVDDHPTTFNPSSWSEIYILPTGGTPATKNAKPQGETIDTKA